MSATMIQVTNVSPSATPQQLKELFSYLGAIEELKLYPEDDFAALGVPSKVCFVNFKEGTSVSTALHLTNSVLIDRALIVARSRYTSIPDNTTAMSLAAPAVALANSSTIKVGHTAPLLPTPPSMTSILGNALSTVSAGPATAAFGAASAAIMPSPSPLISLMGTVVPQPPPLTGNVDPTKIEEIRRTIYVGNLGSDMTAEQVLTFFQPCGEIKYVRMAGDETQPTRFAFVEFATPESVPVALQYNGAMFGDRPIKVNHSKNAIVKPQGPSAQETKRDVDEAMKRVKEAMMDIEARVVPEAEEEEKKTKERSRSRSYDKRRQSRSRSHSRSRDKRRRSRSRSRSRERYRKRSRSRSPGYRNSGGRGSGYYRNRYHRSRSRSPRRHYRSRRSRSRSYSPRRRDSYRRREDSRNRGRARDRSPPPRRRSPSLSPERSPPRKSSKTSRSRKHRNRSASRSPSPKPLNPNERTSSSSKRKSKHSKKHRRHRHKSRSPSPEQSPIATDDVKQEPYQSDDSGDSPPPDRVDSERGSEGESSDVEGRASPNGEREVDVDTDSSYD